MSPLLPALPDDGSWRVPRREIPPPEPRFSQLIDDADGTRWRVIGWQDGGMIEGDRGARARVLCTVVGRRVGGTSTREFARDRLDWSAHDPGQPPRWLHTRPPPAQLPLP